MPHGYRKQHDSSGRCVFCKTHKNGEKTTVKLEKLRGKWMAAIEDAGQTKELGTYTSKAEAKTAAKNWMKRNPKGLQQTGLGGGGLLPGMDGAQHSNDFWS